MAFWNVTGGAQVTTFDANGFAVGTDVDQGSIRAMSTGTAFSANPKFTNVPLGEENPMSLLSTPVLMTVSRGVVAAVPGLFNGGDQVITKATTDIAGVSNNVLLWLVLLTVLIVLQLIKKPLLKLNSIKLLLEMVNGILLLHSLILSHLQLHSLVVGISVLELITLQH